MLQRTSPSPRVALAALALAAVVAGCAGEPERARFPVEEATIAGLHEALGTGRATCRARPCRWRCTPR